jgi:hypothetical protein
MHESKQVKQDNNSKTKEKYQYLIEPYILQNLNLQQHSYHKLKMDVFTLTWATLVCLVITNPKISKEYFIF